MTGYQKIAPEQLAETVPPHGVIIDVRTPAEHAARHIGLSHAHVPLDQLDPASFMAARGLGPDAEVCILCHSGMRAAKAAATFAAAGYRNVKVVDGGIVACESGGHRIVQACATRVLPLDRQVRIAAGTVVLAGSVLALLLHPFFAVVPLLAGAGLVFAGVTDRCGLALLLARAPWNRK